ncbi:unnamed protein product, partial [Polarella glacialis]
MSCRDALCPEGASAEKKASCASDCEQHPFFCTATCADFGAASAACKSCRTECAAACECSLYCEPLIKDAANCVEQGGRWLPTLSQNFDNVWSAMLTLFEISSTEGWADVMHVACDGVEEYVEPIRDYNQWAFVPFFMVYMFFSAMFIINLSVGVIVDKFMDLKHAGAGDLMLTDAQRKWVASHRQLCNRNIFFDLTDLHKLPPLRRKAYRIISHTWFHIVIMTAIALNSASMAMKTFPSPFSWWDKMLEDTRYFFFALFLVEMVMKLYALRSNYWQDRWNTFDFFCVVASSLGYFLTAVSNMNFSAITSLFRVA